LVPLPVRIDPKIGRIDVIARLHAGFWFWGSALFGAFAVAIFVMTFITPGWLAS
jgi:hypothetical protein